MRHFIVLGYTSNSKKMAGKVLHMGNDRETALKAVNERSGELIRQELYVMTNPEIRRHFEDVPKKDVKEDVPKKDVKEDVPKKDVKEDVPKKDVKEDVPKKDVKEDVPKKDVKEDVPKKDVKKTGDK